MGETKIEKLKDKKLLTRQETADYIGMSMASTQRIISERGFPAVVRLRGRVFIHREKLDQWIDAQAGK